jgi:hypothetical protein
LAAQEAVEDFVRAESAINYRLISAVVEESSVRTPVVLSQSHAEAARKLELLMERIRDDSARVSIAALLNRARNFGEQRATAVGWMSFGEPKNFPEDVPPDIEPPRLQEEIQELGVLATQAQASIGFSFRALV